VTELIILEHLTDLPKAGLLQTSEIHTPEEAQAWAAQHKATRVYFYAHRQGYKSAFIVLENPVNARRNV
jgi:hypothetical protein